MNTDITADNGVDSIFTDEELKDFEIARTVRSRVIKEYTEGELPKSFDMDRLLTAASHLESGALSLAKIRIKQQEVDGKDVNNALLAKLVLSVQSDREKQMQNEPKIIEVDDSLLTLPDHLDVEPVDGGTRIGDPAEGLYDEIFGS